MLSVPTAPGADPALLAFVKCHVSSFARWDVLRTLVPVKGQWVSPDRLAAELHKPVPTVVEALDELVSEEIVEADREADGASVYRLNPDDPTTRVAERLIRASTRDQDLRRLLIARIVGDGHRV